ncbi:hypothetical protein ACKWTF_008695 [Chironomus riparius]
MSSPTLFIHKYRPSKTYIFIFTPFSRVNLLVLIRLKNQFFEFCEDIEQDNLKCSEMKSLCLECQIFCKKTDFKLVEALLRKSQNMLSVSKQASKQVNQQEISITRHRRNF